MFQTFVTGPIGARGFGLVGRCVECRARGGMDQARCTGFGAGCLAGPPREAAQPRGFAWAPLIDVEGRLAGF
jgi:hypothetical protein